MTLRQAIREDDRARRALVDVDRLLAAAKADGTDTQLIVDCHALWVVAWVDAYAAAGSLLLRLEGVKRGSA